MDCIIAYSTINLVKLFNNYWIYKKNIVKQSVIVNYLQQPLRSSTKMLWTPLLKTSNLYFTMISYIFRFSLQHFIKIKKKL